jgi:hypothetical protein
MGKNEDDDGRACTSVGCRSSQLTLMAAFLLEPFAISRATSALWVRGGSEQSQRHAETNGSLNSMATLTESTVPLEARTRWFQPLKQGQHRGANWSCWILLVRDEIEVNTQPAIPPKVHIHNNTNRRRLLTDVIFRLIEVRTRT